MGINSRTRPILDEASANGVMASSIAEHDANGASIEQRQIAVQERDLALQEKRLSSGLEERALALQEKKLELLARGISPIELRRILEGQIAVQSTTTRG